MTFRIPTSKKNRIHSLANKWKRSASFVLEKALDNFIETEEWKEKGIKKAIESLDEGKGIDSKVFMKWAYSLDTSSPLPRPSHNQK